MLFLQLLLNGLVTAGIYGLLAIGFGIVYRSLRFFHIAYGAIYTVAAYLLYFAYKDLHLPLSVSTISAIGTSIIVGLLMDFTVYSPLEEKRATSGVLFIASLGLYIIAVNIIALLFGNETKVIFESIQPSFTLGSLILTRTQIFQLIIGWGGIALLWLASRKNTTMKAIWAMGEVPTLIKVLGFPWKKLRVYIFGISSAVAALCSILVSSDIGVDPYVGMHALLTGAVAVIIGGIESYWAWVGGAFVLSIAESIAIWKFSAQWQDAITLTILILTLLFKPYGIFSSYRRKEEM